MPKKVTKKEADVVKRHLDNPMGFTVRDAMAKLGRKYDYNTWCRLVYRTARQHPII